MSLFQCDKCGCLENSASTNAYHLHAEMLDSHRPEVGLSYREVLGLSKEDEFGKYCSACTPIWYTVKGDFGIGPRPVDGAMRGKPYGQWHGRFERIYLPKGLFHTNASGNLAHIETLSEDLHRYKLPEEDKSAPRYPRLKGRVPEESEPEGRCWTSWMKVLLPHHRDADNETAVFSNIGGLPALVGYLVYQKKVHPPNGRKLDDKAVQKIVLEFCRKHERILKRT